MSKTAATSSSWLISKKDCSPFSCWVTLKVTGPIWCDVDP